MTGLSVPEERSVTMQSHQVRHYQRMREIMASWFVALDKSEPGSGKTVVATAVALSLGLSLIVIAPPMVHDQWRTTAKQYGVPLVYIASYQRLRMATSPDQVENALVRRLTSDELVKRGNEAPSTFEHTPFLAKLLAHGVLIIFDEFHMVKTDRTLQLETAHCIIRALVHDPTTVSRAALLSATPCDLIENAVSLLKMLGILTYNSLLPSGVIEIGEIAKEINPGALIEITKEYGGQIQSFTRMKPKRAAQFAFDVYRNIFGPWLSSTALTKEPVQRPLVDSATAELNGGRNIVVHKKLNGFFRFPPEDDARLRKAYDTFASLAGTGITAETSSPRGESGVHMVDILIEIELAKVQTLARLIDSKLKEHPNNKVIAYLNYRAPLERLAGVLASHAPLSLNGDTSTADRKAAVQFFQRPTDEARLLIAHPSVGGVGVNLDDIHGGYPRTQYACSSFFFINICQLMGRVARTSTKSDSESYLVFSKAVPEELRMLDNLSRKAKTSHDYRSGDASPMTITTGSDSPRPSFTPVYPGEYESYYEADDESS